MYVSDGCALVGGAHLELNKFDTIQNYWVHAGYAQTDENGWYSVLFDNEGGPWDLEFTADGYNSETVEGVTIPEGDFSTQVDMALIPAGSIDGTITDYVTAEPLVGLVTATSTEGETWVTMTDSLGFYEFIREFDLFDTYSITFEKEGYLTTVSEGHTFGEGVFSSNHEPDMLAQVQIDPVRQLSHSVSRAVITFDQGEDFGCHHGFNPNGHPLGQPLFVRHESRDAINQ